VLTTTLRALRTIGDAMKQHFELLDAAARPEVLVQGELPKRVLMERFREGANEGRAGCVLVASASFWEGFDAPGDALQLVVIDKLPFPPPNDPLVEARSQRLEAQGRSSFSDYSLPEAAVALKQGAGRLIRRETDSGVLAICDTGWWRWATGAAAGGAAADAAAGNRGGFRERHRRPQEPVLMCLPLREQHEAEEPEALLLTRPSTKGRCCP
jgi:hypothetical protein